MLKGSKQYVNRKTLRQIQTEAANWRAENFPDQTPLEATLGVCEESGELAHHVLKLHQGIRGSEDAHIEEIADAVGDIVIYLTGVCDHYKLDLHACIEQTWQEVAMRNWTKNKETGETN